MQASTRALMRRGGAACAAAVVLFGGTFTATAAMAAPANDATPTSIATSFATATAAGTATTLPDGLAEVVEQDLGKTAEEFNTDAVLAAQAADVQAEVTKADPSAVVSVNKDTIKVKTTAVEAAKSAATSAKVPSNKVSVEKVTVVPSVSKPSAANVDALLNDYVAEFGISELQSVMVNGNGEFVIRTGDAVASDAAATDRSFTAAAAPTAEEFAAKYGNVTVEAADGPASSFAADVTNGQGYALLSGQQTAACSIGWNGFNAAGDPAIITAGHCADDGAATRTLLTDPTMEPAVGGKGFVPLSTVTDYLGSFGASQFGGAGNTPATAPADWDGQDYGVLNNIGTDVAVIDDISTQVTQLAQVTDWSTPEDPQASGPKVTGISDAIVGTDICKSGRTTGWTCGTVDEVGVFLVAGTNYDSDPDDIRAVRGFGSTNLEADHGDSGGAIIAGNKAVGMVSAGTPGVISYGVSLSDALAHTEGYTIKLSLSAPKIATTDSETGKGAPTTQVYRKGTIAGTVANAPAGTTVTVTIDGKTTTAKVTDGKWSVTAPNEFGTFDITAQTENGFSSSSVTKASVEVIKETLSAPAISTPANGSTVAAPVKTISGTGKAGATIELSGDVEGTVVVGEDGKWSVTPDTALVSADYTVTAKQTLADWNDSKSVTSKFSVVPAAPAVSNPANGAEFTFNEGPATISGTNIAGATVSVTINGTQYDADVVDGTWTVTLDAALTAGDYTMTAVQTVDGVESLSTGGSFTVLAEPAPAPTTAAPTTAAPAPTTVDPAPTTVDPAPATTQANKGGLANTGVSGSVLALALGGGLLLLAGTASLLIRRRSSH